MSTVKRIAVAVALCGLVASCGGEPVEESQPEEVDVTVVVALRWPLIADTLDTETNAPEQCEGALSESLVVCTWMVRTQLQSDSEYFSAEVGGWKSEPERVSGGGVIFRLDTEKEHEDFGSEAEVDPTWTRQ